MCQKILAEPEDRKDACTSRLLPKAKKNHRTDVRCGKPVMSLQQEYCFDCSKVQ